VLALSAVESACHADAPFPCEAVNLKGKKHCTVVELRQNGKTAS